MGSEEFSHFFRFSSFFFAFLRFSSFFFVFFSGTRANDCNLLGNLEFHSDPVSTDPVRNFPIRVRAILMHPTVDIFGLNCILLALDIGVLEALHLQLSLFSLGFLELSLHEAKSVGLIEAVLQSLLKLILRNGLHARRAPSPEKLIGQTKPF